MKSSSRAIPSSDKPITSAAPSAPHQVQCDLCEAVMDLPRHCVPQGVILGLLTCSACIEDQLAARQLETENV